MSEKTNVLIKEKGHLIEMPLKELKIREGLKNNKTERHE
jgi:hypothetical protein